MEAVRTATDDIRSLIDELDRRLAGQYRPEQRQGVPLNAIFQPHMRFFLARLDREVAGCGGVALFGTFGEVKRMYVRDDARGRGIARVLLSRIELETKKNAIEVLRSETGDQQFAAIRLYDRAGFCRCEAFGEYASMAPQAIATSVFFEKLLL